MAQEINVIRGRHIQEEVQCEFTWAAILCLPACVFAQGSVVSQLFVGNAKLSEASLTQLAPGHFLSFWDL